MDFQSRVLLEPRPIFMPTEIGEGSCRSRVRGRIPGRISPTPDDGYTRGAHCTRSLRLETAVDMRACMSSAGRRVGVH